MFHWKRIGLKLKEERLEKCLSIILRVPALFILDYWYQIYVKNDGTKYANSPQVMISIVSPLALVQSVLLLVLPLDDVVTLYVHYVCAGLLLGADALSRQCLSPQTGPAAVVLALGAHAALALAVPLWRGAPAAYAAPLAARLAGLSPSLQEHLHRCANVIAGLWALHYCLASLPRILSYLRHAYACTARVLFTKGPLSTLVTLFLRRHLLPVCMTSWCAMLCCQLYRYACMQSQKAGGPMVLPWNRMQWYLMPLYAMSEACSSPFSLVGCCIAVSYASWAALTCTNILAQGWKVRAPERAGMGEGITMALLSLQTGLVDLGMPRRVGAMSLVLFIVAGSLLESMHELAEPALLALSARNVRAPARHARVLLVCLFLLVCPILMAAHLCRAFPADFWTLVVVSTCALTSVQVLGALTVYVLFLYDAVIKDSSWESLDDTVYVARAVTRVLEFVVALLVVVAGVRELALLVSEGRRWSWLDGSVLAAHCYSNVYQRLQSGWGSFLQRRDAARRTRSLPSATPAQLSARDRDVCPICQAGMDAAKVTACGHLFHACCLRRWIYVQPRCPLCSAPVGGPPVISTSSSLSSVPGHPRSD